MAKIKTTVALKTKVLKIPVILEGFAFKKQTQDWNISFSMQPENLEMGKPLMNYMGDHFVLVLVKVDSIDTLRDVLANEVKF